MVLVVGMMSLVRGCEVVRGGTAADSGFLLCPIVSFLLVFKLLVTNYDSGRGRRRLPTPSIPSCDAVVIGSVRGVPGGFAFSQIRMGIANLS